MSDIPNDSIFLVIAEQGSYSDYMTWVTAAYLSDVEAKIEKDSTQASAKYQRNVYSGWCRARHRICRKKYGEQSIWQLTEEEQNLVLTWPRPRPSKLGDTYSVLEVPIGVMGEYWPDDN